jgi:signal transduction histidine kinase
VLVLSSFDQQFSPYNVFNGVFRTELSRSSPQPVQFIDVLVPSSSNQRSQAQATLDYLQTTFATSRPTLIVSVGGVAALFAQQYRSQIFPETPMLLSSVDQRFVEQHALPASDTAVTVTIDTAVLVENILRVLPDTTTIMVVVGSSPLEVAWRKAMAGAFAVFGNRVAFVWTHELTFAEILARSASLPPRSAILFAHMALDAAGGSQVEDRALPQLRAVANAPIFGCYNSQIGHGVVGGPVVALDQHAENAAAAALRLLNGEAPSDVVVAPQRLTVGTFDAVELERWNIDESRLPAGSIVLNRRPTAWKQYRGAIVTALSIGVVETALIAGLLVLHVKRRRAERLHMLAKAALSNLSQRLMHAQEEERTRIARELHDNVSQQLATIRMQLEDLIQREGDADGHLRRQLADVSRQTLEVTTEVRDLAHGLHSSKLQLLGLPGAAAAFCRDFGTQHHVTIRFTHQHVPERLPEEIKIGLFRVVQEALMNAVKYSGQKEFDVTLSGDGDSLRLDVIDHGAGFDPAAVLEKDGLGLVSMRERLGLIGGQLTILSRPGAGTTIRASVPRDVLRLDGERDTHQPGPARAAADGRGAVS